MNHIRTAGTTLRRHPRWSGVGMVVVLAAIGGGIFLGISGSSSASTTTAGTTTIETATTGTIKQSVAATGTLAPAVDDTLTFGSSGTVTSVLVAEGQTVTAGQALATIDSAALAATVAQDAATVANDQAKVAADQDGDATAAQLAADQAALTAAQTALASAQTALAGATLTSPVAGVVASVGYTAGESTGSASSGGGAGGGAGAGASGGGAAASSATTTTATTAGIRVISTDSWLVDATVDATGVDLIATGDQAELTISGATEAVYGTISSIAVLSSSTGTTASYPVVIAVTGTPTGLHDGESVTAALVYKQLTNVLEVPTSAVHRSSDGGAYVDKVTNGTTTKTTVQVGVSAGGSTQITSGLVDGDQVQVTQIRPGAGTTGGTTRTGTGGERGGGTGGGFGYPPGGFGGGAGTGTGGGFGG